PRYATPEQQQVALTEIETRLAAIPSVTAVGAIDLLPLGGGNSRMGVAIEGRETKPGDPPTRMHPRVVTPGYFHAMDIPITGGRAFSPADTFGGDLVVIVSQTAATRYWPGIDPVGKRMRFGGDDPENWRTVVGVAGDVRHWGFNQDINPMVYWPQAQARSSFLTF